MENTIYIQTRNKGNSYKKTMTVGRGICNNHEIDRHITE